MYVQKCISKIRISDYFYSVIMYVCMYIHTCVLRKFKKKIRSKLIFKNSVNKYAQ